VLRFFAFKNYRENFKHDVDDFLTEYMEGVSDQTKGLRFDYVAERDVFQKTFTVLDRTLAELSFTYANKARTRLTGGFSVYHFEAISVGLQPLLNRLNPDDQEQMARVKEGLQNVKLDPDFIRITTGGGKNSPGPLRERIDFLKDRIAAVL
jgi:hypothetical protein